jgi:hypothetical protein
MSKLVDVSQARAIWLIFRVLGCLENCSNVRAARPGSHSHVVEIGIVDEGEQAAVLIFPPDAGLSRCSTIGACTIFP